MGKASILNKLNYKLQAHARVCEENKELEEKQSNCPLKYFVGKGLTLEGCRRTVTLPMALKFATRIVHNTKVLVIYNAKQKHLGCKKGEANQKQQLSDYKSIHSYTCD